MRGLHCDLIFGDEAFYIPQITYKTNIIPMSGGVYTAMILTSTPGDEGAFVTRMLGLRAKRTRELVFSTIRVGGEPCADCARRGVRAACPHSVSLYTPWKDDGKLDDFDGLYEETGDAHMILNEKYGIVASSGKRAFDVKHVELFFDTERLPAPKNPLYVFMTVDPAGGGASDHGIAAYAYHKNEKSGAWGMCLIFLEAMPLADASAEEERERIIGALRCIRNRSGYSRVPIAIAPETDPGKSASTLISHLSYASDRGEICTRNVMVLHEAGSVTHLQERRCGVPKLKHTAYMMVDHMSSAILRGGLTIASDLGTLFSDPRALLEKARKQMLFFSYVIEGDKISMNGKGSGCNDDTIMVLLMVWWNESLLRQAQSGRRPEYAQFFCSAMAMRQVWGMGMSIYQEEEEAGELYDMRSRQLSPPTEPSGGKENNCNGSNGTRFSTMEPVKERVVPPKQRDAPPDLPSPQDISAALRRLGSQRISQNVH